MKSVDATPGQTCQTTANTVSVFNALGQRVDQSGAGLHYYNLFHPDGSEMGDFMPVPWNDWGNNYFYLNGRPVAKYVGGPGQEWDVETFFFHANAIGSTSTMTWYNGDVVQKELFYPYGQRVKKASGTLYWHGVGGEVLAETDLSGNNLHEFIYFAGRRIARREPSGGAYYFYQDHLGTAKVMLNGAGLLRQESTYYPFGSEQRVINNTIDNRYKFTGMERDAETGNDHTWFRSYESNLGRWLSPDPLAGDITNPQSLNRYAYVLNNPTNLIDPLGLTANPADPCYDSYFAMTHAECPTAWPYPGPTIGPHPGGGGGGGGASSADLRL